jgi:hypothetical protein
MKAENAFLSQMIFEMRASRVFPYAVRDAVTIMSCVPSPIDGPEEDGGTKICSPKANWYPKAPNADSRRDILAVRRGSSR